MNGNSRNERVTIIKSTAARLSKLLSKSFQEPPRIIVLELVIAKSKIGIIIGKPRIAIMTELFPVLPDIDEIMVKALDNPIEPKARFRVKYQ